VIAAHTGFGFHFPVLELASQRALQQAIGAEEHQPVRKRQRRRQAPQLSGTPSTLGPEAAAWPQDWLFQDTLLLRWALQTLTQQLRTQEGLMTQLTYNLRLGKCFQRSVACAQGHRMVILKLACLRAA
jgi:hypothetical protein